MMSVILSARTSKLLRSRLESGKQLFARDDVRARLAKVLSEFRSAEGARDFPWIQRLRNFRQSAEFLQASLMRIYMDVVALKLGRLFCTSATHRRQGSREESFPRARA